MAQNTTLFRNEGAGKDVEILYHLFFDLLESTSNYDNLLWVLNPIRYLSETL